MISWTENNQQNEFQIDDNQNFEIIALRPIIMVNGYKIAKTYKMRT